MFFHLPERIYDYIKDDERVKSLEDELKEKSGTSFLYSKSKVQNENEILSALIRTIAKALKNAPEEIIREFRIMTRCENVEYLEKCARTDPDLENRLCCYYQLTNCNVDVETNKKRFLYEYSKATRHGRALFSSTMHNVAYIFKGEKVIAEASSVKDAVEALLDLRRKVLEVPCAYHEKLEKTTSVEFIAHLFFTYCKFRNTITKEEADFIINKCLDMQSWCGKVYNDVWLGNFRTTILLYSVLMDRLQKKDPEGLVKNAFHMLAGYLVSSFSDRANTIKSLTTHNEDFRARYIVLAGACIRLLNFVDEAYVKENILPLVGQEETLLSIEPLKDGASDTPVSDNIIKMLGLEEERLKSLQIFENEIRKGFEFLAKKA